MKQYEITWYPAGISDNSAANHKWFIASEHFPARYSDRTLRFQRADGRKVVAVGGSFVVEEML